MDTAVVEFFQHHRSAALDHLALWLHWATHTGLIYVPLLIMLLLAKDLQRQYLGRRLLATLLLTYAVNDLILKLLIARPRPFEAVPGLDVMLAPVSYSMPSGQTAVASSLAMGWWLACPRRWSRWLVAAFAVLVALDRLYMGHHYLSDVLAGAAIGMAVALLVLAVGRNMRWLAPPSAAESSTVDEDG